MKLTTVIATALAIAFTTPAQAQSVSCAEWGQFAEDVMTARQSGVPLSDMMAAVESRSDLIADSAGGERAVKGMVLAAWDMPRQGYEDLALAAVQAFRNGFEGECYRMRGVGS